MKYIFWEYSIMTSERSNRDEISKYALLSDIALRRATVLDRSLTHVIPPTRRKRNNVSRLRKANNTYFPGNT